MFCLVNKWLKIIIIKLFKREKGKRSVHLLLHLAKAETRKKNKGNLPRASRHSSLAIGGKV